MIMDAEFSESMQAMELEFKEFQVITEEVADSTVLQEYMKRAESAAQNAENASKASQTAASESLDSASKAATSATEAKEAATKAETAGGAASEFAASAEQSKEDAAASETNAAASASVAEQAKTAAETARDEAVAAGKEREPLIVNITDNGDGTGSADKTFAEIAEALLDGREIQTWCNGIVLPKPYSTDDSLYWAIIESWSENGEQMSGIAQILVMLDRENNVGIDIFATDFLNADTVNGLIDEKLNSLNATGVSY